MNFKPNFLGITVADFESSLQFYTEVLGIETKHSRPDWAAFRTTGMKFELFSGGRPPFLYRWSWIILKGVKIRAIRPRYG